MIRRSFFQAACAALGIRVPQRVHTSEFGLGDYVSHKVEVPSFRNVPTVDDQIYNRYYFELMSFPIEAILTIQYKHGIETYITFNLPRETIKEINQMSGAELASYAKEDPAVKKALYKYDGKMYDFGKNKFKLTSFTVT